MAENIQEVWRPTPQLERLARAAVWEDERARQAWEEWSSQASLHALPVAALRVLPLLYRNLQRLGIEHPYVGELSKTYRLTWATNQLAMRNLEHLLAAFEKQEIPTLILKGAALSVRYYKDLGTRPMADFDVLVPMAQTDAAIAVLHDDGWFPDKPLQYDTSVRRAPFHGLGFFHPKHKLGCDLHWHVMHIHLNTVYDAPLWEAAMPAQVGKVATRTLCPEHQLIHLFFNGCISEGGSNMRWLVDALMVLKHEPTLEWGRLVAYCQLVEFVEPVAAILEYLRTTWEIAVPDEIIETLRRTPVSYRMRQAYRCLGTPKEQRSGMLTFWLLYTQYQMARPQSTSFFPLGFVQFLAHRWSLDSVGKTLNYARLRMRGVDADKANELA